MSHITMLDDGTIYFLANYVYTSMSVTCMFQSHVLLKDV